MPGLFSWYNNQYASWNRMRGIHAPPFVARVDSRASRNATAMAQGADVTTIGNVNNVNANAGAGAGVGDVVINMTDLSLNSPLPLNKDNKDTLFGPSIGVANTAPEWCAVDSAFDEKAFKSEKELELDEKGEESDVDELTPEIVKEWVKRSKEPSEPTTTLQALVNLKRPSIRLSPLAGSMPGPSSSPDESTDALAQPKHQQQHGLEFEFDCDASQCFISLHVVGVPASMGESDEHHDALQVPGTGKDSDRLVLFETTLSGGFSKKLTLADGAVLELAKLEAAAKAHRTQLAAAATPDNSTNESRTEVSAARTPATGNATGHEHHRKRLMFFKRGRHHFHSPSPDFQPASGTVTPPAPTLAITTGPALAVVDAEAPPHNPNNLTAQNQNALATFFAGGDAERARQKKQAEEEGVRIAIRLAARDGDGRPMRIRNEQVTYLHIVRQGPPALSTVALASGDEASSSGNEADSAGDREQTVRNEAGAEMDESREREKDDTRPWVVRVVKREARIGAHSFQLHEIYGLTAHVSEAAAHQDSVTPSSPTAAGGEHTYPPASGQPQTLLNGGGGESEDSPAECLLCLSAAREVVLLPCRHLVACRECAINMVEFGAGGTVVQPAETEAPAAANGAGNNAAENAGEGAQGEQANPTPAPVMPTPATRRKRKAKGWFCPVCRQPYTSLLRITTAPPPSKGSTLPQGTNNVPSSDAKRVSLTSSLDVETDTVPSNNAAPVMTTAAQSHPLASVTESGALSADEESANDNAVANVAGNGNRMEGRGGFPSLPRPGFLRHFPGRARERDLERGT